MPNFHALIETARCSCLTAAEGRVEAAVMAVDGGNGPSVAAMRAPLPAQRKQRRRRRRGRGGLCCGGPPS